MAVDADAIVARWLVKDFKGRSKQDGTWPLPLGYGPTIEETSSDAAEKHLKTCPDAVAGNVESEGRSFYETGVTGMNFTADITCPHGHKVSIDYDVYGSLSDIIRDLDYIRAEMEAEANPD